MALVRNIRAIQKWTLLEGATGVCAEFGHATNLFWNNGVVDFFYAPVINLVRFTSFPRT